MNKTLTTTAAAVLLATGLTACSASTTTSNSDKPKASHTADSVEARCRAQHWPQHMPNLAGRSFDPLGKVLQCFDHVKALAPDGHDVMNDSGDAIQAWAVVSSKPASGTLVNLATPITLALRDPSAASASPSVKSTPTHSHSATPTKPAAHKPAPARTTHRATVKQHTNAPAVDNHGGATAMCNDGTLSYSQHHQGTCSHHHGVAVWYN
ncbi:DUF3761 domain-containing protein [Streptomyces mirabilis]|uniref:DUF3761 domain-containing protein n=1 Tax=Streptomyces mirabilis TaxID=68239 RepID=UPI0036B9E13D